GSGLPVRVRPPCGARPRAPAVPPRRPRVPGSRYGSRSPCGARARVAAGAPIPRPLPDRTAEDRAAGPSRPHAARTEGADSGRSARAVEHGVELILRHAEVDADPVPEAEQGVP